MTKIIYCLRDPFTKRVRYVGSAVSLRKRLNGHVTGARKDESHTEKSKWILRLLARRRRPLIQEIERVSLAQSRDRERHWIQEYVRRGEPMLNALTVRRVQKVACEAGVKMRVVIPGDVTNDIEAFRVAYLKRTGVPLTKCHAIVVGLRAGLAALAVRFPP